MIKTMLATAFFALNFCEKVALLNSTNGCQSGFERLEQLEKKIIPTYDKRDLDCYIHLKRVKVTVKVKDCFFVEENFYPLDNLSVGLDLHKEGLNPIFRAQKQNYLYLKFYAATYFEF